MAPKKINQPVNAAGKDTAPGYSAPNWFIDDQADIQVNGFSKVKEGAAELQWGPVFSKPQDGNAVEFFTTGEEYFKDVAAAISSAKSSVFIAGWQVNYDVELVGKKTLLHCLDDAVRNGASVYVMPWLSPKVGVDTGDFETMLAVLHLNAGRKGARAYCLPSMQQGDQGTMGIFFAHHQKLVVIDNKSAYVGGIDLAYGRRDNGNFSLKPEGRKLNEFYNTCVPPIHDLTNVELQDCVTRAELLAAGLTAGAVRTVATFFASPSTGTYAKTRDGVDGVKDFGKELNARIAEWWRNENLLKELVQPVQDGVMDAAQNLSKWAWERLDPDVRGRLGKLRQSGSANASDAAAAVLAWLNNADLSQLPPELTAGVSHALQALVYGTAMGMQGSIDKMGERYDRLFQEVKNTPGSGTMPDPEVQPRMPWHDVQCRIEGPSVYDLADNFVRRWNGTALSYEKSFAQFRDPLASTLLKEVGVKIPAVPKAPRVQAQHMPARSTAKQGSCSVQVLRSAPRQMLKDEAAASGDKQVPALAQNDCLKAMLKAIGAAQKFIYIEGQFFTSAYGDDIVADPAASGPMGALVDIRRSPGYQKFVDMLEIRNVPVLDIPKRIRWAKVDDVLDKADGPEFLSDVKRAFNSVATINATNLLGKAQDRLKNPIGKALVNRIKAAIDDGVPFHVYMVLPVHPEGTLDTINIMTQVHLTMQSLVFGKHSLVNGVRRAVMAAKYRRERKMTPKDADEAVNALDTEILSQQVGDEWKQYLTLLNLRNWDTIGGKPVTEQIYVHSKLLIADDRVAIIGSANINDRSLWGDRDSELAVIVTDNTPITVKLDGVHSEMVAASVQKFRRGLWGKLFGLKSKNRSAASLATSSILDSPAAAATWKAIQELAESNAGAYESSFVFIARDGAHNSVQLKEAADKRLGAPPSSIWPTWMYATYLNHNKGGQLKFRMPFDPLFWRDSKPSDVVNNWNVTKNSKTGLAPVNSPADVRAFIVSLPTKWTFTENNQSGINLTAIANNDYDGADSLGYKFASNERVPEAVPGSEA